MHIKIKLLFVMLCAIATCAAMSPNAMAQLTVVSGQKSTFTIVLAKDAIPENREAAEELQKCVEMATGVKLPVQDDAAEIKNAIISIGENRYATAAGIDNKNIPFDSFHIVTKNGNIYIIGNDTPIDGYADLRGKNYGSASGVYTFLEDYLNVRWLMPGDIGRDVPAKSTFTIPEINRSETPLFSMRRLPHILTNSNETQFAQIKHWQNTQKLGGSTWFSFNHNWLETVKPELFKEHPDWFALIDGKRVAPTDQYGKFESTNPEVINFFAQKAVEKLKKSSIDTFSLSPSDGRNWSQSPESKALYDPSPNTVFNPEAPPGLPSMSSLILKWYHDVSQIVQREYPQGRLAGYIYADYLYPPVKQQMKLPENFTPVIAPSFDYGYELYRPKTQKQLRYVMSAWEKVVPEKWYCFDLPNTLLRQHNREVGTGNFPGTTGTVTPIAPDILNMFFATMLENRIKGVYLYGNNSWSNSALSNYVVAKMEWNPHLDAHDVQREWLQRAYGIAAGNKMELFYKKLDGLFRDYYLKHGDVNCLLTLDMFQRIYGDHYHELEVLFLDAKNQQKTEMQAKRLQLIENNLVVLQWRLRNAGYWNNKSTSTLQRTDAEVVQLLQSDNEAFPLFPGIVRSQRISDVVAKPEPYSWRIQVSDAPLQPQNSAPALGADTILIYTPSAGEVQIIPEHAEHGKYFASYQIKDAAGREVAGGIFLKGQPITFEAKANRAYYLVVPQRRTMQLELKIANAKTTNAVIEKNQVTLEARENATLVYARDNDGFDIAQRENDVLIGFSGITAEEVIAAKYPNTRKLENLNDNWRFMPDGENSGIAQGFARADFNDANWKILTATAHWQDQGFLDYHGTAWYRKSFEMPNPNNAPLGANQQSLLLFFGAVDGDAVVYINGEKAGEHLLGNNYQGWNDPFVIDITKQVKPGKNSIAVQVTKKTLAGGITKGVSLQLAKK